MSTIGRKCLAVLLSVGMLFSLVGSAFAAEKTANRPPEAPFFDTLGTRYQTAVEALYALNVVKGKSENSFEPESGVTRAEMATFVVRALGAGTGNTSTGNFSDVPQGHWAVGHINAASAAGIVKGGTDGRFRPSDPVTYPEVVAMLLRAVGLESKAGEYPIGYVLLARELGLIDDQVSWGMDKAATRGDVALMLYRTIFTVKRGGNGLTLSQTVFKVPGAITIEPETSAVTTGTTQLAAKAVDWAGNSLDSKVTWAVTSGQATISQNGTLNATAGPVTVTVTGGGLTVSKTYSVIKSLTVTAEKQSVSKGAQVQLTAAGMLTSGGETAVQPAWSVVGGEGTITSNGLLTVTGTGAVKVRAAFGGLSAETTVNVVGGINITPAEVAVAAGQDVQFSAAVVGADGKAVNAAVTWSVSGGGTIDQNGKLRVGSTPATVTVKSGDFSATATVKVINRIEITPGNVAVQKGGTQKFTATVYTSANEVVATPVTLTVEPASLGFFGKDNVFFGSNAGSGSVVASAGGLTTKVPVSVGGQAAGIVLSASPVTLPANGSSTTTITARLVDAAGVTAGGVDNLFLSVSSANLGTLDKSTVKVENGVATTILKAGTVPGTYTVMVSAPGYSIPGASMSLTTTAPAISHIALEVYPNPMAADGVSQTTITARLVDATGAPITNNTANPFNVTLMSSNTAVGRFLNPMIQIPVGQKSGSTTFVAGSVPGTTAITGSSAYTVRSATLSTQVVGNAVKLHIRPLTETGKADSTSELTVNVEVQDANGNVRTGDNSTLVSLSAISGATSITVPSQQVRWGVATFTLKTARAGTYALTAWSPTASIQNDTGEAVFTPGAAYKLGLSADPSTSLAADNHSTVTLRAKVLDVNDNVVTTATNQIRFMLQAGSQGVTVLPTTTTMNAVSGEASMVVTASNRVGSDSFYAEADGLSRSSTVSLATRITGVPVKVIVQPLAISQINAGTSTTVKVWVLDQLDQLVTSDNGRTVYLNATNGATVSGPAVTVNGVATFTVSSTKSGGAQITATADGLTPDLAGRTLSVAQGQPDHIVLSAMPEAISADGISRTGISAKLVDRYGNLAAGSFAVALSLSTSAYLNVPNPTVITGGQVDVFSRTTPGTTVISGTANGYVVTPLTITTYVPGVPSRVVVDSVTPVVAGNGYTNQVTVKARILDNNGNVATSLTTGNEVTAMALRVSGSGGTGTTTVSSTNTSGLSTYSIYPNGTDLGSVMVLNGMATFTVTNTRAETISLTPIVYYKGVQLSAEPGSMTTTPGVAARLNVTSTANAVSAAFPTTLTVMASVADIYGNPVPGVTDTITFTVNNSQFLSLPAVNTVDTTTGTASLMLTSKQGRGGQTIVSAVSKRWGFQGSMTITADLPPEKPQVFALDSNGTDLIVSGGDLGARITVSVPGRISPQTLIVYVNGVVVPVYTTVSGVTVVDPIASGGSILTGYIKRADLGTVGTKEIRVVVQTQLGISPVSDPAVITVQ